MYDTWSDKNIRNDITTSDEPSTPAYEVQHQRSAVSFSGKNNRERIAHCKRDIEYNLLLIILFLLRIAATMGAKGD